MYRLEFILNKDDFVNAACFAHFRLATTWKDIRKIQIAMAVALFCIAIAFFDVPCWFSDDEEMTFAMLVDAAIVFLLFPSLIFYVPSLVRSGVRKTIRKQICESISDRFGKLLTVELHDDGITTQNFRGQIFFHYSTVCEILEHEGIAYVFFDKTTCIILPRDRIPAETLDVFLAELKTRVAACAK